MDRYNYANKVFDVPTLTTAGMTFIPASMPMDSASAEPVIADINTIWDTQKFNTHRSPYSCGFTRCLEWVGLTWADGNLRVLDMPIKMAGDREYRLPVELARIQPLVEQVAKDDARLCDNTDSYCYLTYDHGIVQPGSMQRNSGFHVDGFQGIRIEPKVIIDRSYVVSDCLPTIWACGPFDVGNLDPARDNFFKAFDRYDRSRMRHIAAQPYQIMLMDAYCVHTGTQNTTAHPVERTFVRLTYSVRQFDRLGNTHNPLFDYNWEMVPREFQAILS